MIPSRPLVNNFLPSFRDFCPFYGHTTLYSRSVISVSSFDISELLPIISRNVLNIIVKMIIKMVSTYCVFSTVMRPLCLLSYLTLTIAL